MWGAPGSSRRIAPYTNTHLRFGISIRAQSRQSSDVERWWFLTHHLQGCKSPDFTGRLRIRKRWRVEGPGGIRDGTTLPSWLRGPWCPDSMRAQEVGEG